VITVKIFEFNPVAENTCLLYDETKEAVIIDCGCLSPAEEKRLSGFISENELKPKRLLCTHLHFDHVLGNAFINRTYGLLPEAHRNETKQLPSLKEQIKLMHLPFSVDFVDVVNLPEAQETISFGRSELIPLLTPGHSPGSLSFYCPQDHFIVVGDALFRGSIGRTDLWGGDYDTLITAIKEKILSLPDETIVYPGHGTATSVEYERRYNPFLR
jgi:glyoxylase-like metal-dependent hydrolase (beta-lactamase superfamily II)